MNAPLHLRLRIATPLARVDAPNYRPSCWPPKGDWPVVCNANFQVVSRWQDIVWILDHWAGEPIRINFCDGQKRRKNSPYIDRKNADIFRLVVGWWIWGPHGVGAAKSVHTRYNLLKPLFVFCAERGIAATDLSRFPAVLADLAEILQAAALPLLHDLYDQRRSIGITLLDQRAIAELAELIADPDCRQTPYIPPRLWLYQVTRLREVLDDYLAHESQVRQCYKFALQAYIDNYGSLANAINERRSSHRSPFQSQHGQRRDAKHLGHFKETLLQFGLLNLLDKWVPARSEDRRASGVRRLTSYLLLVSRVGQAYIINFSLMRDKEARGLRAGCLRVESDEKCGSIYLIQGETTKTIKDKNALWPTSPSAQVAVDAMESVARLRLLSAVGHEKLHMSAKDKKRPLLQRRALEPWLSRSTNATDPDVRLGNTSYASFTKAYPALFDQDVLRIRREDAELARLVTPTLDEQKFAVGKPWPLAWHQLRRTGAVNMQASGIVSDPSVQYVLKHATRALALYYGQGYSRLALNDDARALYLRAMYEAMGRELTKITTDRFVSPYGDKRKESIVRLVSNADMRKLTDLARSGAISCKEIHLGLCMNPEPCVYWAADSVAHCGGGVDKKPCTNVLYDRQKRGSVTRLRAVLKDRFDTAPNGSPLKDSTAAQLRSVESYFDNIDR
jgi:hypothetical protein